MKYLSYIVPLKITTTERDALTGVPEGAIIYNTTTDRLESYSTTSASWIAAGAQGETLTGGAKSMILAFTSNGAFTESSSNSYDTIARFIFAGTDTVGDVEQINSNCWVTKNSGDIRIVDSTNGGNVIAQVTGITSTSDSNIVNMGTLSNMPTTRSTFEVQVRKTGGGAKVRCSGIEIEY